MTGLLVLGVGAALVVYGVALAVTLLLSPARAASKWDSSSAQRFRYPAHPVSPAGRVDLRRRQFALAAVAVLAGLIVIFFDSFTVVQPGEAAVTSFLGKQGGEILGPGAHWVRPWYDVTTVSTDCANYQTCLAFLARLADQGQLENLPIMFDCQPPSE